MRQLPLILALAIVPAAMAQERAPIDNHVRIIAGVNGGSIYGNDFLDLVTGIEAPLPHSEADAAATFTPLEHKIGLGFGTAWSVRAGGIAWLTRSVGLNTYVSHGAYRVARASKAGSDLLCGVTFRTYAFDAPLRLSFDYVRQIDNHLVGGTESNYLQGGDFNLIWRMGAVGPTVWRMTLDVQTGWVKDQGNPVCDGTLGGRITCPRTSSNSGGASIGLQFEFPRRHGFENSRF
jgi:hypothetical protein